LLLKANIKWLPIDPFRIAKQFGWIILTASEMSKESGIPPDRVIRGKDSDVYEHAGVYKIIYNETAHSGRIPFTIAHEIGHIVLNHLIDFDQTRLSRGGLTDDEYYVLEREADLFASELLMPAPILREIGARKESDIRSICNSSISASHYKENDLTNPAKNSYIFIDRIKMQFSIYLTRIAVCTNSTNAPIYIIKQKPGSVVMEKKRHPYVVTDENGRFTECPNCGSKGFSEDARFCFMCGTYLFNDCTNTSASFGDSWCGRRNRGDARYCEYCGSETVLTHLGLIMAWEEVVESYGEVAVGLEPDLFDEENKDPVGIALKLFEEIK
jgi:hypothetical protein